MKRCFSLFVLFAVLAVPAFAHAETTPFAKSGRFGLGVGTGTLATGITGKGYFSDTFALQGTVGYWYWGGPGVDVNVDAIFELPKFYSNNAISFNGHLGFGGAVGFYGYRNNDPRFGSTWHFQGVGVGLEGVGGLGLQIKSVPLELVVDVRPAFYFGGDWWGGGLVAGGASIRYFFK